MARIRKNLLKFNLFLFLLGLSLFIVGMFLLFSPRIASAVQEEARTVAQTNNSTGWGLLAAALAVGFSSIGAGIAVSGVGSAAMGAVAERPELMGRSLIYVGLAEGIAIYGLIVAIMVLAKI